MPAESWAAKIRTVWADSFERLCAPRQELTALAMVCVGDKAAFAMEATHTTPTFGIPQSFSDEGIYPLEACRPMEPNWERLDRRAADGFAAVELLMRLTYGRCNLQVVANHAIASDANCILLQFRDWTDDADRHTRHQLTDYQCR